MKLIERIRADQLKFEVDAMTADAKVDSVAFLNTLLKQKPFVYAPQPPSPFTTAIKPSEEPSGPPVEEPFLKGQPAAAVGKIKFKSTLDKHKEIASKKPKVLHLKATFGHDVYMAKQYVRLTMMLDSGWKTVQFFDGDEISIYLEDL